MRFRIKVDGVSAATVIEQDGDSIFLVKNKKSRIIMKEGAKILEINEKVKEQYGKQIVLETTAPVCSKTIKVLEENSISIVTKPIE